MLKLASGLLCASVVLVGIAAGLVPDRGDVAPLELASAESLRNIHGAGNGLCCSPEGGSLCGEYTAPLTCLPGGAAANCIVYPERCDILVTTAKHDTCVDQGRPTDNCPDPPPEVEMCHLFEIANCENEEEWYWEVLEWGCGCAPTGEFRYEGTVHKCDMAVAVKCP